MRHRVHLLALASLLLLTIARADSAWATTCNIPLAVGQAGAQANVLILLDDSGSMNEAIVSADYNASTNWSGNFSANSSYNITTSGTYYPKKFNNSWPSTPTAYLVTSDRGESGVYYGNYLNWLFFHATAAQRAAIPVVTRIQSAKSVVNTVLSNVTGCQFAVETFNAGTNQPIGGTVIAPFGTPVPTMQSLVNNIDANTWTPLAEALVTGMNYFQTTGASAPFQSTCQQGFVVIVTDGMPTQDTSVPSYIKDNNKNGYYLDDVASYMYRHDLRADMTGIQNVAVFTIGYNVDATASALLQTTADQGGGASFSINDGQGLMNALTSDFNIIAARVSSGSSVSVVSSENRTNDRLYRARYESQTWKGYLEAFDLPYHSGVAPDWEAGALLAAVSPASRTIYTSTTGTSFTAFSSTNASALQTLLGAADVPTATNIINYVRGAAQTGMRDRGGWVLGDVVDASPLAMGPPNSWNQFLNYGAFRAAHSGRAEAVFLDANDGMLHCFNATTGAEMWGFVPKNQLSKLSELMSPSYCHDYFLNMTPVAYDVYLSGHWRTMMIGGDAQGGTGLFAIDVTSPTADSVSLMWDVNLPTLKGSWNGPSLIHDRTTDSYLLAAGTGYDPTTAQTNLLVLNPGDGSIRSTIALGSPVGGNKTTKAVVLDKNFDGYDDLMYLGDLAGNVWRVDLTTNPWSVSKLFSCGQPIQEAPSVTMDQLGRPMLFFGTGEYLTASDPGTTTQQTIYAVIDDGSGTTLTPSSLVNQTSTISAMTQTGRGWYVNLSRAAGERVIRTPALVGGVLYVPSFLPNSSACTSGGQSWLYSMDYTDGSGPTHVGGLHTTSGRSKSMGDGILADPSVDLLNEQIILQSSNAVLLTQDITAGLKRIQAKAWRQRWN